MEFLDWYFYSHNILGNVVCIKYFSFFGVSMYKILKTFYQDQLQHTFIVGEVVDSMIFSPLGQRAVRKLIEDKFIEAIHADSFIG